MNLHTVIWILLGLFGLLGVYLFLYSLMRMSKEQDHVSRKEERRRFPFSDVEVTVTRS